MLEALQALCPKADMPPPTHTKMLNWRTSQVVADTVPDTAGCVVVAKEPPLVLAGDWCVESSFQGCATSAVAATEALLGA